MNFKEYLPIPLIDDLKYIIYDYAYDYKEHQKRIKDELQKLFMIKVQSPHMNDTDFSFKNHLFYANEHEDFFRNIRENATFNIFHDDIRGEGVCKYIKNCVKLKHGYRKKRRWKYYLICNNILTCGDDENNPFILDTRAKTLHCTHTKKKYDEFHFKIDKSPYYKGFSISKKLFQINILISDNIINAIGLTKKHIEFLKPYM